MTTPRGIKNQNPGNIRKSKDKWQGLADNQPDSFFFSFIAPEYGIRAMIKILWTYQDKYSLESVRELIGRWAPPTENNTESYIKSVAKAVGVSPDCKIDTKNTNILLPLVKSIIMHENGIQPYDDELVNKAINLAKGI